MLQYEIIGVMSGTSLDGLDIAYCRFKKGENDQWSFEILEAETITYSKEWENTLVNLMQATAEQITLKNVEYGKYIGQRINQFLDKYNLRPDCIASHGHTVFHNPQEAYTLQIGKGEAIYVETNITTVFDFRSLDIALGGQGAPLVPVGDLYLFGQYDYCLNLGGIANISEKNEENIIAYDICPCNIILNYLANQEGLGYDNKGIIASKGLVNTELLEELNNLSFYQKQSPKSIGREWIDELLLPVLGQKVLQNADIMATCVEHIAIQINNSIRTKSKKSLLITGGGAFNDFLIERIKSYLPHIEVIIPDKKLIEYKEALIFAFLGLLKLENKNNCLASVTGATRDSSGGIVIRK